MLSIYDNLFQGTVPAALTTLAGIALAYNPYLVGPLPAGFTTSNMYAWSAYYGAFYRGYNLASSVVYGGVNYGTGVLRGTSIGHDRPVVNILRDLLAALDPNNSSSLASSWLPTHAQPCPPWLSSNAATPNQLSTTPVRAAGTRRLCGGLGVLTRPRPPRAAAGLRARVGGGDVRRRHLLRQLNTPADHPGARRRRGAEPRRGRAAWHAAAGAA
jgi:hypothetical protein